MAISEFNPPVAGTPGDPAPAQAAQVAGQDSSGNLEVIHVNDDGSLNVQGVVGGTPIPISGSITATNPSVGTDNTAAPTSATQVGGTDGANLQAAKVFDLDSGAGADYNLGVSLRLSANGGSVEGGTSGHPIRVDPTGSTTQPVSATSLPLPTGAATETTLASRVADSTITNRINTLGQHNSAGSTSVVLASDQSALTISGEVIADQGIPASIANSWHVSVTDGTNVIGTSTHPVRTDPTGTTTQPISAAGLPLPTGAATEATLATRLTDATFTARVNTLGQKTMAASTPVVLASDQASIPVTGTFSNPSVGTNGGSLPASSTLVGGDDGAAHIQPARAFDLDTSAGTEYSLGVSLRVASSGGSVEGGTATHPIRTDPTGTTTQPVSATSLPLPTGAATEATLASRVADSTVTARLNTLGQKTAANSAPVVLASDQTSIPVTGTVTSNQGTAAALAGAWPVEITDGTNVLGTSGHPVRMDPTGTTTQPISATSLPLPTGAATETTLSTRLADSTFTGRINTQGQKTMAASTPVVISSDQSAIPVSGSITATNPSIGSNNAVAPTSSTQIGGTDGTNLQSAHVFDLDTGAGTEYNVGVSLRLPASGGSVVGGTSSDPLRTDPTGTTTQPISASSLPLPTGAATEATLATRLADSTFTGRINTQGQKTMSASTPVVLASDQSAVTVTGTVTSNIGTTNGLALDATLTGGSQQAQVRGGAKGATTAATVTSTAEGTDHQALDVQLYSGGSAINPTQIRALTSSDTVTVVQTTASNLSATVTQGPAAAVAGSWPVEVTDGTNVLGVTAHPLRTDPTGTTIQPVSGTVTSNQGTANATPWNENIAQWGGSATSLGQKVSASSVPVVLASDQSALPVIVTPITDRTQTGSIISNQSVAINSQGLATVLLETSGTWTGTIVFEGLDPDTSTWVAVNGEVPTTGVQVTSTTTNGQWLIQCGGFNQIRARGNTVATGTATISLEGSVAPTVVTLGTPLPTGSNTIGSLIANQSINLNQISGSSPSLSNALPVELSDGTNLLGTSGHPVRTDPTGTTTQPISATSLPLPTGAATEATLGTRLADATFTGRINTLGQKTSANSTPVVLASDQSSVTVTGTTTANQGTANSIANSWPVEVTDGTNVLGVSAHPIRVDPTGTTTQPVSGTVTANIGTTNGLALDATLTGGAQQAQVRGGAKGATTAATVTSTAEGTDHQALDVQIYSGGTVINPTQIRALTSSDVVTAAQTTAANLAATVTQGPAATLAAAWPVEVTDGTNILGTSTHPVRTDPTGTTTQPVSGTVTSNQGTAAALAGAWPVEITDGTNILGTAANPIRVDPTGTTTQKVSIPDQQTASSISAVNTNITTGSLSGFGSLLVQLSGAWVGVVTFEATSENGTNYQTATVRVPNGGLTTGSNANGVWRFPCSGFATFRVRSTSWTSGTATVTITASAGSIAVALVDTLPAGTNTIGVVNQGTQAALANAWSTKITDATNGPVAVKAASTAAAAADPSFVVGLSPNSPLPTGTNSIGTVVQGTAGTAAQGWFSRVTDGTNTAAVKTASTAAVATDPSLVVALSPNSSLPAGTNSVGTVVQGTAGTAAQGWFTKVTDGTNTAAVKAASTAVAAADPVLAVGISPNSPLPTGTNSIGTVVQGNAGTAAQGWFARVTDGTNTAAVKAASTAPVAADPALVTVISPNQTPIPVTTTPSTATTGLAFGDPTYNATTTQPVRRTAYTEQTVNFTGSIRSSSTNDTSAGTGARQVTIFYVDSTGATAGNEVVTLNGTTAVNLVTTTKCFIEKMTVTQVGSGSVSAGTITLFTGAGATGTTVGTIQAGDNQTYWAHHYVVTGKSCNVTSSVIGGSATAAGNGAVFFLRSFAVGAANTPEVQITGFLTLYGQSSMVQRTFPSPIKVTGPARVLMYVTPVNAASSTYRGSFDYYDQ